MASRVDQSSGCVLRGPPNPTTGIPAPLLSLFWVVFGSSGIHCLEEAQLFLGLIFITWHVQASVHVASDKLTTDFPPLFSFEVVFLIAGADSFA